jgi:very-short-patch-repair endonuclease
VVQVVGMFLMRGPQPWRTNRSRALRSRQVSAEEKLWEELRNRRLSGFKFVRQAAIGSYFADFACRERKLIVEVDGATHGSTAEIANDVVRTSALEGMGYRVCRATNDDVTRNIDGVLEWLLHELERAS